MVINPVATKTPDIKGLQDLQANNGLNVSGQTDNRTNEGKANLDDLVTINNTTGRQAEKPANVQSEQTKVSISPVLSGTKGVIALDDDKNVVIRFFDNKGKVVAQYPPEDYLKMMKELNQVAESLFHKKV